MVSGLIRRSGPLISCARIFWVSSFYMVMFVMPHIACLRDVLPSNRYILQHLARDRGLSLMSASVSAEPAPPLAEAQFDIGFTEDSLERMIELFARHGDIYRVFVPTREAFTYVIHHPDDVRRVLLSNHRNYTKGAGVDRIKLLLGKGLMTSEGELWRRQRYMMQPFFHRRVMTNFATLIAAVN